MVFEWEHINAVVTILNRNQWNSVIEYLEDDGFDVYEDEKNNRLFADSNSAEIDDSESYLRALSENFPGIFIDATLTTEESTGKLFAKNGKSYYAPMLIIVPEFSEEDLANGYFSGHEATICKKRPMSTCISSDYCYGWNDAMEAVRKKIENNTY